MQNLSHTVDLFISQLTSAQDGLLGECESHAHLTPTQEHILMLLAGLPTTSPSDALLPQENESFPTVSPVTWTNSEIAAVLRLTPAAVTKALKKLAADDLIVAYRDSKDSRRMMLQLTEKARPIAREHADHHVRTLKIYDQLLKNFTDDEQITIKKFLAELSVVLQRSTYSNHPTHSNSERMKVKHAEKTEVSL